MTIDNSNVPVVDGDTGSSAEPMKLIIDTDPGIGEFPFIWFNGLVGCLDSGGF